MDSHIHKINRDLIIGWMVIVGVLFVSYCGEVLKGERSIPYLIAFMLVTGIPPLVCAFLYKKQADLVELRYYIVVGYFIMYLFCMITGSTSLVFCYILPMLSLLVLYHQPKLILYTGMAAMLVNLASLCVKIQEGELTLSNSKDGEIQVALLFLCFAGSYTATRLYDEITKQNTEYVNILDEKNNQIQKMTLQTIATIANTIDAKDEYTRGHSRRVSEYSMAIAQELGLSEDEVYNIRSVALLHDIGKIGVPDAVLNKPGRLTDEEYQLMKQHTIVGSEILKDIRMLPGIDVGARYHHERYDGKGYPDGLKGEQIPFIARIIAAADAYDAMTSNRVYRKRLDNGFVLQELKNGSGKQFDPQVVQALIRLLEENRLGSSEDQEEDTQELTDMTRILSRVMEKREEQFAEKIQLDELTGVFNRSYGEKLMIKAMEQGRGCFMLLDLDHFRMVNGNSGFVVGDVFLSITAKCIQKMRKNMIASRFGGDEFAVLLENTTRKEEVCLIMDEFMDSLHKEIENKKELEGLSVSAGIVFYEEIKDTFSDVMKKADRALYFAKQQGGGTYYFHNDDSGKETKGRRLAEVDLNQIVNFVKNTQDEDSNIQVTYPELHRMLGFIKTVAQRNQNQVQILMFTVLPNDGEKVSVEEREHIMGILERAIIISVRDDDMTTKYSSTQRIVMLINREPDQVETVTNHIMKEFYKMYAKKEVSVYYDTADLSRQE